MTANHPVLFPREKRLSEIKAGSVSLPGAEKMLPSLRLQGRAESSAREIKAFCHQRVCSVIVCVRGYFRVTVTGARRLIDRKLYFCKMTNIATPHPLNYKIRKRLSGLEEWPWKLWPGCSRVPSCVPKLCCLSALVSGLSLSYCWDICSTGHTASIYKSHLPLFLLGF